MMVMRDRIVIQNRVVGCSGTMRTRGDGCQNGTDSGTGIQSIGSHLLMVYLFLVFDLVMVF